MAPRQLNTNGFKYVSSAYAHRPLSAKVGVNEDAKPAAKPKPGEAQRPRYPCQDCFATSNLQPDRVCAKCQALDEAISRTTHQEAEAQEDTSNGEETSIPAAEFNLAQEEEEFEFEDEDDEEDGRPTHPCKQCTMCLIYEPDSLCQYCEQAAKPCLASEPLVGPEECTECNPKANGTRGICYRCKRKKRRQELKELREMQARLQEEEERADSPRDTVFEGMVEESTRRQSTLCRNCETRGCHASDKCWERRLCKPCSQLDTSQLRPEAKEPLPKEYYCTTCTRGQPEPFPDPNWPRCKPCELATQKMKAEESDKDDDVLRKDLPDLMERHSIENNTEDEAVPSTVAAVQNQDIESLTSSTGTTNTKSDAYRQLQEQHSKLKERLRQAQEEDSPQEPEQPVPEQNRAAYHVHGAGCLRQPNAARMEAPEPWEPGRNSDHRDEGPTQDGGSPELSAGFGYDDADASWLHSRRDMPLEPENDGRYNEEELLLVNAYDGIPVTPSRLLPDTAQLDYPDGRLAPLNVRVPPDGERYNPSQPYEPLTISNYWGPHLRFNRDPDNVDWDHPEGHDTIIREFKMINYHNRFPEAKLKYPHMSVRWRGYYMYNKDRPMKPCRCNPYDECDRCMCDVPRYIHDQAVRIVRGELEPSDAYPRMSEGCLPCGYRSIFGTDLCGLPVVPIGADIDKLGINANSWKRHKKEWCTKYDTTLKLGEIKASNYKTFLHYNEASKGFKVEHEYYK